MKRRVFDILTSIVGLGLAVLLLIGGGLALWAHNFISDEVHKELSNQQIFFPKVDDKAFTSLPPDDQSAMKKYAGELMTTGAQAETYANHYIAVHLEAIGGGKTYSQLSAQLQTLDKSDPNYATLSATVETMFKGETLRGLLLNAYAFGTIATIAGIAAIVFFVGGGLLLILSAFGLWHSRRVSETEELLAPHPST